MVYLYFVYLFLIEWTLPGSGNLWHASLHHPLLLSTWRHGTAQCPTITSPLFHPSAPTPGSLQMEAPSLVPAACLEMTRYICWGKTKHSLTVTLTHTFSCSFFKMLRTSLNWELKKNKNCWELFLNAENNWPQTQSTGNPWLMPTLTSL